MTLVPPDPLIARRAEGVAVRRLRAARAVVINGPRQSGKTALLGILQRQLGGTYLSLDQATNLRLARTDPTGFVTGFDEPLFIDEVRRGGDPNLRTSFPGQTRGTRGTHRQRPPNILDLARLISGAPARSISAASPLRRRSRK